MKRILLSGIALALSSSAAWAGIFEDLHEKLGRGEPVAARDVEPINSELSKNPNDPFKHLVAAELLINLGMYDQAEEQFAAAERLKKGYVQAKYAEELRANHHTVRLITPYMQKKYPDDGALLFYKANLDFVGLREKHGEKNVSLKHVIEEFRVAAEAPNPWPGSLTMLASVEFFEAERLGQAAARESLIAEDTAEQKWEMLRQALKHVNEALVRDPQDLIAKKIRIMVMAKGGIAPGQLEKALLEDLKSWPLNPDSNLLLGKIYMARKDYASATRPLLIALAGSSISPGLKRLVLDLARNVDPMLISETSAKLVSELSWEKTDRGSLYLLQVADILTLAGKQETALKLYTYTAQNCSPALQPLLQLRLGQVLTLLRRYDEACLCLDRALEASPDPDFFQKVTSIRERTVALRANAKQDIAAQLKQWLRSIHLR